MKALAMILILIPGTARAIFGIGGRSARPLPILWIPEESFSDWAGLAGLAESCPDVRFSIAATPGMIAGALPPLGTLAGEGRLEAVLRLPGDPLLPLVLKHPAASRPRDPARRLALAREEFRSAWGVPPSAFVPGGGALPPSMIPLLRSMNFLWTAVGSDSPASSAPWRSDAGLVLAALEAVRAPDRELHYDDLNPPDGPDSPGYVIDEAAGLVPPGAFLRFLAQDCGGKRPKRPWITLSSAAAFGAEPARSPSPASWVSIPDAEAAAPLQKRAWTLYGDAVAALELYQNSGAADIEALEKATLGLYEAQAGRFQAGLDLPQPGPREERLRRELEGHLADLYRRLGQAPPATLGAGPLGKGPSADSPPAATAVRARTGPGWVEFENPGPGKASTGAWRLAGLRVEWSEAALILDFRLRRTANPGPALESLALQAYIDLNRQVGAGSTSLVEGRGASIAAADAWEFAVAVASGAGRLFRLDANGAPLLEAAGVQALTDPGQGAVRIRLPRERLRGQPQRWGYVAVFLDPADPAGRLLGALAPAAAQKELVSGKPGARLPAARAAGAGYGE